MTPLERAARAIYKLGDNGPYTLAEEDEQWHHHVDTARAVLEAIREPSEGMVDAAQVAHGPEATYRTAWRGMIDAALAEGEG